MSADTGTKLQVNIKTPGGTLLNVYAATTQELEYGLDLLVKKAQDILDIENLYKAANTVVQASPTTQSTSAVVNVTSTPAPPVVSEPSHAPGCKHGPMIYRESKPGAAKAWRAYFCPTPKGTPDQCEPQWIKG
jgi:hypothetical protein